MQETEPSALPMWSSCSATGLPPTCNYTLARGRVSYFRGMSKNCLFSFFFFLIQRVSCLAVGSMDLTFEFLPLKQKASAGSSEWTPLPSAALLYQWGRSLEVVPGKPSHGGNQSDDEHQRRWRQRSCAGPALWLLQGRLQALYCCEWRAQTHLIQQTYKAAICWCKVRLLASLVTINSLMSPPAFGGSKPSIYNHRIKGWFLNSCSGPRWRRRC